LERPLETFLGLEIGFVVDVIGGICKCLSFVLFVRIEKILVAA